MLRRKTGNLFYTLVQSQLFNLSVDPNEIDDLADDKSYAEKISDSSPKYLKLQTPKKLIRMPLGSRSDDTAPWWTGSYFSS